MTCEEALEKVRVLNGRGLSLLTNQYLGRKGEVEFCAGFFDSYARTAGEFYAKTLPEAIGIAAKAAEEWVASLAHVPDKR